MKPTNSGVALLSSVSVYVLIDRRADLNEIAIAVPAIL